MLSLDVKVLVKYFKFLQPVLTQRKKDTNSEVGLYGLRQYHIVALVTKTNTKSPHFHLIGNNLFGKSRNLGRVTSILQWY